MEMTISLARYLTLRYLPCTLLKINWTEKKKLHTKPKMFCMILQTLDLENGIPGLHKGKIRHQKELTLTGDHQPRLLPQWPHNIHSHDFFMLRVK